MKTIRQGVFETNSSSMHTFTIADRWEFETIELNDDWNAEISFWEFWWGFEKYNDAHSRLSYIATYVFWYAPYEWDDSSSRYDGCLVTKDFNKWEDWLYEYTWTIPCILKFEEIIKEHTWASGVRYLSSDFGYIDHQSVDEWKIAFDDMLNAAFREKSFLIIDNDNH